MPPTPNPVPEGERNLHEARKTIQRLRSQLKASAPNTSAELGMSANSLAAMGIKQPAGGAPIKPLDPPTHPNPHPGESPPKSPGYPPPRPGNLGLMPPKMLVELLEQKTDQELAQLLAAENSRPRKEHNPDLCMRIYRELKQRRK